MSNKARLFSFALIELLIMAGTLALLVCVLIPTIVRQKRTEVCRNNLRQIGAAFRIWNQGDVITTHVPLAQGGTMELVALGQVFVHFRAMSNELPSPKVIVCPMDRAKKPSKTFSSSFGDTNVSYFIGADASDAMPLGVYPKRFMSGDRNLSLAGVALPHGLFVLRTNQPIGWTKAIHHSCGHLLLADGSVQMLNSSNLALASASQQTNTNRLLIP